MGPLEVLFEWIPSGWDHLSPQEFYDCKAQEHSVSTSLHWNHQSGHWSTSNIVKGGIQSPKSHRRPQYDDAIWRLPYFSTTPRTQGTQKARHRPQRYPAFFHLLLQRPQKTHVLWHQSYVWLEKPLQRKKWSKGSIQLGETRDLQELRPNDDWFDMIGVGVVIMEIMVGTKNVVACPNYYALQN